MSRISAGEERISGCFPRGVIITLNLYFHFSFDPIPLVRYHTRQTLLAALSVMVMMTIPMTCNHFIFSLLLSD